MAFWKKDFWGDAFWADDFWTGLAAETGTIITNTNATTSVPSNYTIDDITGWREYPGTMQETWRGLMTRQRSFDQKHPQENIKGTIDRNVGPQSPEPTERFLADGEITASDL